MYFAFFLGSYPPCKSSPTDLMMCEVALLLDGDILADGAAGGALEGASEGALDGAPDECPDTARVGPDPLVDLEVDQEEVEEGEEAGGEESGPVGVVQGVGGVQPQLRHRPVLQEGNLGERELSSEKGVKLH